MESFLNIFTSTTRAPTSSCIVTSRVPLDKSIPPCKARCCQCWLLPSSTNLILVESFNNTVLITPVVLEENFRLRKDAYLTFPSEANNSITRKAIGCFQVNIKKTVKHMDHVCYC